MYSSFLFLLLFLVYTLNHFHRHFYSKHRHLLHLVVCTKCHHLGNKHLVCTLSHRIAYIVLCSYTFGIVIQASIHHNQQPAHRRASSWLLCGPSEAWHAKSGAWKARSGARNAMSSRQPPPLAVAIAIETQGSLAPFAMGIRDDPVADDQWLEPRGMNA